MPTASRENIYDKISDLEGQLQKLKLEAYFLLPEKRRADGRYAERILLNAVKKTRGDIWNKRYAKKIARVH